MPFKSKALKNAYQRQWRAANPARGKARAQKWRDSNRDKVRGYGRDWGRKNRDKVREAALRRKYGITRAEMERLLAMQGGKCKLCKVPPKVPHVDHCHTTNKVRGILCQLCNQGLGLFQDDSKTLRRAAAYLEKHYGK